MINRFKAGLAVSLALILGGCASQGTPLTNKVAATPSTPTDGIHWFRDSAEAKAIYLETYRAATDAARMLSKDLTPHSWGVILDIDETVLDNSEYQKRLNLSGQTFTTATWNAWIGERAATILPGAQQFIDIVTESLHGNVVLVTNRQQAQCEATEDNLRKLNIRYQRILCDRDGNGDKNGRFDEVVTGDAQHKPLNVLIWIGDNIQDFPRLTQKDPENFALFGSRYFALPNPMYGSWTTVPAR